MYNFIETANNFVDKNSTYSYRKSTRHCEGDLIESFNHKKSW